MKAFQRTDIGMQRSTNQDASMTYSSPKYLFGAVCDGMGGANAGNVASILAKETLYDCVRRSDIDTMDLSGIKSVLRQSIRDANRKIFELARKNPAMKGMGTTLVAAVSDGTKSLIFNVGDSRAYLFSNNNTLLQITKDHSVVEELISLGHITREEAMNHPDKNIITMALGPEEDLLPDVYEQEIKEGDILLLCSDGLSNMVSNEEIRDSILLNRQNGDLLCKSLVKLANEHGGPDNITVVLMMF